MLVDVEIVLSRHFLGNSEGWEGELGAPQLLNSGLESDKIGEFLLVVLMSD